MSCDDCRVEPKDESQRRVLVTLLAINGTMFVAEIIVGILAQSSGVIADSLDMLADALVYGVGLYAIGKAAIVKRRAAWWSGVFQLLLATSIVVDVVRRALVGSEPQSNLMMIIASVALSANAYCFWLLQKHREGEVHMRASWIFSRSDVIANAGVIVAGLLVRWTESRWPDLIVGAAISLIVINAGISILRETRQDGLNEGPCAGD
jgi:cation diffusion facilitator family transporter